MAMSLEYVLALLTSELRAAGYCPSATELARMRAFLAELDAANCEKQMHGSDADSLPALRQAPISH